MHIVLVAACSKDGFIADISRSLPSTWTSPEDKAHFKQLLNKFPLHVMGRKTFEAHLPKPEKDFLKVVLSTQLAKYASYEKVGQLEFQHLTPREFVERYNTFRSCLVLGGKDVYTDFIQSGLVNEAFVTVEPIILNSGVEFLAHGKSIEDYGFKLASSQQMNESGTVLNHYILIK